MTAVTTNCQRGVEGRGGYSRPEPVTCQFCRVPPQFRAPGANLTRQARDDHSAAGNGEDGDGAPKRNPKGAGVRGQGSPRQCHSIFLPPRVLRPSIFLPPLSLRVGPQWGLRYRRRAAPLPEPSLGPVADKQCPNRSPGTKNLPESRVIPIDMASIPGSVFVSGF